MWMYLTMLLWPYVNVSYYVALALYRPRHPAAREECCLGQSYLPTHISTYGACRVLINNSNLYVCTNTEYLLYMHSTCCLYISCSTCACLVHLLMPGHYNMWVQMLVVSKKGFFAQPEILHKEVSIMVLVLVKSFLSGCLY
jgi:hypothetical protein